MNVVGGNTDADSLTSSNIGVVADDTTGTLNVKLAKNLTELSSVKVGDAVTLDASGLTITGGLLLQHRESMPASKRLLM